MLNRFRTGQGRCAANLHKWHMAPTDRCQCGDVQTMVHIVESCPLTRFADGDLFRLHSADDGAVTWLKGQGEGTPEMNEMKILDLFFDTRSPRGASQVNINNETLLLTTSLNRVLISPGAMALTRMFFAAHESAMALHRPSSAVLLTE